jgi:CHAD domain-containing protein
MARPAKPVRKAALNGGPRKSRPPVGLNAAMSCDTAFRIIARRYLDDLNSIRDATAEGDIQAVHRMRIVLTHLRAAIQFFSPIVDDQMRDQIRHELKWLNGQLGTLRDLDVAISNIKATKPKQPDAIPHLRVWHDKRAASQRTLARSLKSARYRHLIAHISSWIESGRWATTKNKQAAKRRAAPIGAYSADRLTEWKDQLIRKSRKLRKMGAQKRHRLRLLNKKLNYAIESVEDLFGDKPLSRQKAALKQLRRAQKSLGRLNDDVNGRTLARALRRQGVKTAVHAIGEKQEKRLLRSTEAAYRKLAALKLSRGIRSAATSG